MTEGERSEDLDVDEPSIVGKEVDWFDLAYGRYKWWVLVHTVMNLSGSLK